MIRVLHVINSLAPAGAETLLVQLCAHLPQAGVQPVVAYVFGDDTLEGELKRQAIHAMRLSGGNTPSITALARAIYLVRARKIQIVHTHLVYAGIVGKLAAAFCGVPVVSTRHFTSDPKQNTIPYRMDNWLTRHYASRLIAVSENVRNAVAGERWLDPRKVVVHRNAIDVAAFEAKRPEQDPSAPFVVGTVGRLETPKAHEIFVEAVALLRGRGLDVRGVIAGDGRRRRELEGICAAHGVSEHIRFLGNVAHHDMPALFASFDAFVLSSHWEGLPLVLIEAAASGLPIVATDVGAVKEIVEDGRTGFVVALRDASAIANAVHRLIAEPDMRDSLGKRGRVLAQAEFDISILARKTADLYREILGVEN
jgi:glycosyltransferase involved in cell wall biosynthesis